MLGLATTSNENKPFAKNEALISTTTARGDYVLYDQSMRFIDIHENIVYGCGVSTNASVNPTVARPFITVQQFTNHEEDTLRSDVSFASFSNLSFLKEATETQTYIGYNFSRLLSRVLSYSGLHLGNELVIFPGGSWVSKRVIEEEEEEEEEWDRLFNTPHVQEGLSRLAAEARRQFAAGETEEGGFAVE